MDREVDVGRTALVVAGEDRVEFDNAVSGGLLAVSGGCLLVPWGGVRKGDVKRFVHAAEESCFKAGLSGGADAAVYASCVALPKVNEEVGRGFAVLGVYEGDLEMQGHAGVSLDNVGADLFALDVQRTDDVIGGQDTSAVGSENVGVGRVGRVLERAGLVVGGGRPFGEGGVIAAVHVWMVGLNSLFLS